MFAKPEDEETFIIPRGCHSLFYVCVMGFSQGCVTLSATHRKWISHLELLAISQLNHRHIQFTEELWTPQLRLSSEPDNERIEELTFSKKGKNLNLCKSGPGESNCKVKANQARERFYRHRGRALIPGSCLQLQSLTVPWEHCIHTSNHSSKVEKHNTVIPSVGSVAQKVTGANAAIVKH